MSLRVLGVIVAVAAFAVGGLMMVLQTRWGSERLRRQVVAQVNRQIQGQFGIGRLSFGGNRLVLWDVSLRDPEGLPVAQVARAEVDFRIGGLLRKEVRLTAIGIDAPQVLAISDSRGFNLSRATAPRKEPAKTPPAKPKTTGEGWVIRLDRFDLTKGEVVMASIRTKTRNEIVHLTNLDVYLSARYATGNGSTDADLRVSGENALAPSEPLALVGDIRVRGDAAHFSVDGKLLGGTVDGRGDIDSRHLETTDASVAVAIPQRALAGSNWGPLRCNLQAHPGGVPKLDLLLSIPGLELTGKGGEQTGEQTKGVFELDSRLAFTDLALTAKSVTALTAGDPPSLDGRGQLDVTVVGPMTGAPASWSVRSKALFEHVRMGTTTITDLSIDGHAAHLSKMPGEANLHLAVASLSAGTTKLGKIEVNGGLRQLEFSGEVNIATPEAVTVSLAGRIDEDQKGFALTRVALNYPKAQWISEGETRLRTDDQTLSVRGFRLRSQGQGLSVDGSKAGDRINAQLALSKLRLDRLPALVADPSMNLGGILDVDVKADGDASNPRVVAQVRLEDGQFRSLAKIRAKVDATLAEQTIAGTLAVDAPFAALDADFRSPVNPLSPGAPVNIRLDLARLDLASALRGAAVQPLADGRLTAHLRLTGSADNPTVDLAVTGRDLEVKPGAKAAGGTKAIAVGGARVHLAYAARVARGDVDVSSPGGGTLRIDASSRIDLSYPGVGDGFVVKKIPLHGKVVARKFDVSWVREFSDRVEALGGQVTIDAQLAGTIGDPQFVGDVRWANGKAVATAVARPPSH